ncbi:MAG TPA: DUF5063 domain-containing protein [Bacteroidales bacterium]|jgi:hypothetical protein|nr:DUF5063 domain-containing protein [Bacteroidales bacterium]HPY68091.1 DUF5063 domain-containing protein [Bacteroidales bacterium]
MSDKSNHVYSRNVIEFVAVANEFCKYAERSAEVSGDDLLRILQRILPLMYLKASLLPSLEPYFEDGNDKFVTEADWYRIHDSLKLKFGNANDFLEIFDEKFVESEIPVPSSLAEYMADIYQDIKDFLLLYQTGTEEIMNDAVWECKMNFENIWGQKLVNSMKAIHRFIYSGEEIYFTEIEEKEDDDRRNKSEWFISKRQNEFRNKRG